MTKKPKAENLTEPVTLKIVSVGNSKGIRIPSAILLRQGMSHEVELIETLEGILLRGKEPDKLSFEESFAEMAKDAEVLAENREIMEGTVGDGLEKEVNF
jgi:antitoxin MazE